MRSYIHKELRIIKITELNRNLSKHQSNVLKEKNLCSGNIYVKDFKFDESQIEDGFPNKLEHDDLAHLGNAGWELINIVSYRSSDNELCLRYYYKKAKMRN